MKVLILSGDFPPFISGIGDYVDKLATAMLPLGIKPTILTSKGESVSRPFPVLREFDQWNKEAGKRILEIAHDFDLVHIQYPGVRYSRYPMINFLPWKLKKAKIKSIVTIHDFRVMRHRWRARTAPMLAGVDGLLHVDQEDWKHLRRWMPLRFITGKPNVTCLPIASNVEVQPVDAEKRAKIRKELGFTKDDAVVAFFGILYPHKGLDELTEAVATLRKNGRPVKLLVIGDFDRDADWRPDLEAKLRGEGVKWVKGASLERVSECLHAADMAALPYHSGAAGNRGSMLATMSHGLPTITTVGPATPKDFDKHHDIRLVPVNNPAALGQAIRNILDDPNGAARMRHWGLNFAKEMSWPSVAKKHVDFYQKIAGSFGDLKLEAVRA